MLYITSYGWSLMIISNGYRASISGIEIYCWPERYRYRYFMSTIPSRTVYITHSWAAIPNLNLNISTCGYQNVPRWKHPAERCPKTSRSVLAPSWLSSNRPWKTAPRGVSCMYHTVLRGTRYLVADILIISPPFSSSEKRKGVPVEKRHACAECMHV